MYFLVLFVFLCAYYFCYIYSFKYSTLGNVMLAAAAGAGFGTFDPQKQIRTTHLLPRQGKSEQMES